GDALDLLGGDVHAFHPAQVDALVAQTGVGAVGALGLADECFAREHTLGDEDESFFFLFESAFHGLLPFVLLPLACRLSSLGLGWPRSAKGGQSLGAVHVLQSARVIRGNAAMAGGVRLDNAPCAAIPAQL